MFQFWLRTPTSTVIQMTVTQWHALEHTFASTATSLETRLSSSLGNNRKRTIKPCSFYPPQPSPCFPWCIPSVVLQADRGTLARSRSHSFVPIPTSAAGSVCAVSKGAVGVQRTAVFALSPPYVCVHTVTFRQKVSSNSSQTHTEPEENWSWRERNQY